MSFQQYNVYPSLTPARLVSVTNVAGTYSNGSLNNGVGATLTVAASSLTIDSVACAAGDRIVLNGQTNQNENGIYIVTSIGSTVVLTRSSDFQSIEQIKAGMIVTVGAGTAHGGSSFTVIEPLPAHFGVDNMLFNATITTGLGTAAAKATTDNTKASVAAVSGAFTTGNIVQSADVAGTISDGPVAANKVLTSAITTPDVGSNLLSFDVTVGQAALAAGGHVALVTSAGAKQYKIRQLYLNSGGTNFSGGGGDRLGQVSDGTTVYSVIPAATMQSLVNARWGDTALPFPASAAIFTSTVAGTNLFFAYSGGTLDYTAGSLRISGLVERVA